MIPYESGGEGRESWLMILFHILGEIRDRVNKQKRRCELRDYLHKKACVSVQVFVGAWRKPFPAQLRVTDMETAKAPVSAGIQMYLGGGRHGQSW